MQVRPLLDLRVTHPFYDDQRCRDVVLTPTDATAALMRRLRLTCKQFPDHVSLYAELNAGGSAIAAAGAPVALDFLLAPRDETVALITDLTPIRNQAAPLFTNAGVATADPLPLRLTTRTMRAAEVLAVTNPGPAEAFVLAGQPQTGATAASFTVTDAALQVTNFDPASKRIVINTSVVAAGTRFDVSYPVQPPRPPDVLAEVELALDAALLQPAAAGPRAFVVPFAARAARWCYYLLTDYTGDIATLRIVDATPGNGPRGVVFSDSGRVDLSQSPDAADPVAQDLIQRNPGRRLLRFLSDASVACRQSPLRALELHLGDARVLGPLANPPPAALTTVTPGPAPAHVETVQYSILRMIPD